MKLILIVSKIEVQKNNKNRVNIYCDNQFEFSLQTETLIKNAISVGTHLSENQKQDLILQSDQIDALTKATAYVAKGLKTQSQIQDFLKKKDYNQQIINLTIQKLTEYKLLNDQAYIVAYVNDHKSYGELKLKQELYAKGLSKDLIEQYFAEDYSVNVENLQNIANKYLKNKEINYENVLKCKKHLLSKGFTYEDISQVDWNGYESWN